MPNVNLAPPNPYTQQQQAIERQRKLAELMQQQSGEGFGPRTGQGPMGQYVTPISWTEGLAKMLQAYGGKKGLDTAAEKEKALGEQYTREGAANLAKGLSQYRGMAERPAQLDPQEIEQMADQGTAAPPNIAAQPASPDAAMGTWAQHPQNVGLSQSVLAQMLKGEEPYSLAEGAKRMKGGRVIADNPKPQAGFSLTPGGARFDAAGKQIANLPEKVDYNKPFLADGSPNPAYQDYALKKSKAGATSVSIDNKAQGKYAEVVGGKSAENDVTQFEVAQAAKENAMKLDETLNLLKTSDAITGMGADVIKNVERIKVLFANNKKAGKKVSDTEYLNALLGSDVFPMIKELGIGARGLDTPAEREFLREVMSGTINMNKDTLIRMTQIRRNIAQRSLDRWNGRVKSGELDDFFKYANRPKSTIDYQPSGDAPSASTTALPPQAVSQLTEGQNTKFRNGQVWTLKNGVPTQVQ